MNNIDIQASDQACGATVTGLDLTEVLSDKDVKQVRDAWLQYHVLSFPNQDMSDDDLERFSLAFGPFGEDPFIESIEDRKHIIAVQRAADETTSIFAEAWHTDWSFQETPPAGTCLFGITIPPIGGDTLFINQHKVFKEMPEKLRQRLTGLNAIHSARLAYSVDGLYDDEEQGRSMQIRPSDEANEAQLHPIIRKHPETNQQTVFGTAGYIIGFDGLDEKESEELLLELYAWQTQDQFIYRHKWQEKMLIMWDNRSVLHTATGGYEGHARYLHRTTIGETV